MKTKFLYSVLIGLSLSSCSKFLEVNPETELSANVYFKTEADFKQAINGAYVPLRGIYNAHNWVLAEMHSDNTYYARNVMFGAEEQTQNLSDFNVPSFNGTTTNQRVRDLYRGYYQIIARTNQILSTIDPIEFDAPSKNNIKGQALLLRAYSYFELVRFFGKAPLHLEPVTAREEAAAPLATAEDLYALIETWAKDAATLLPSKSGQEGGRVTSGTAKTILANLYLIQKRWEDAADIAKEVIDSGDYSLITEYGNAFSTSSSNKNNAESIFEIQYLEGAGGFQSSFIYAFIPRPIKSTELARIVGPTENQQDMAEEGKNIPTPNLIAAYEAGDVRKAASIDTVTISGSLRDDKTYPYIKKYAKPHALHGNTGINWPVYRYAEVILFYAEALNELNRPGDAAPFLNLIRTRAGLPNTTASSQADMREAIFKERRVELAFENKRWHDLARTGRIEEIIRPYGEYIKANPQEYYFPAGYTLPGDAFTNFEKYFGLPAEEAALTPHF